MYHATIENEMLIITNVTELSKAELQERIADFTDEYIFQIVSHSLGDILNRVLLTGLKGIQHVQTDGTEIGTIGI